MPKSPDNMSQKDQKNFMAIQQAIREGFTQKEIGPILGKKKSYVGYFLDKYGIVWKVLKAKILTEIVQTIKPVNPKKATKIKPKRPVKPVEHVEPVDISVSPESKKTELPTKDSVEKITDFEIDTSEYYTETQDIKKAQEHLDQMDQDSRLHSKRSNEEIIQQATQIDETFYQALLITHVQSKAEEGELRIQDISEIRNYLDNTDKLQTERSVLNPSDEQIKNIEEMADASLKGLDMLNFKLNLDAQIAKIDEMDS